MLPKDRINLDKIEEQKGRPCTLCGGKIKTPCYALGKWYCSVFCAKSDNRQLADKHVSRIHKVSDKDFEKIKNSRTFGTSKRKKERI